MELEESCSSSSSCNATNKEMKMSDEEDRISGLPQPLLHHILSFLDMKEVVHTSLLSKRFKPLWVSLPNLKFQDWMWRKKKKFKYFVDTVLLQRDGSDINKFELLNSRLSYKDLNRIDRWIISVIRRKAQVLVLRGGEILQPMVVNLMGQVKTLELSAVTIDELDHAMNFSCLEDLIILGCYHGTNLTIFAPRLKYMLVDNDTMLHNYLCAFKICAPNLLTLKCKGYMYTDYTFENLSALVTAEMDTMINRIDEKLPHIKRVDKIEFSLCLKNILEGINHAKSLTLSAHGFQAFTNLPYILEGFPVSCPNLKYLKLIEWCNDDYFHPVAKLLECFPHLETLILKRAKTVRATKTTFDSRKEDGGAQLSFDCTFCHLKSIEIQNIEGYEDKLKFLEHLLDKSTVLENITITSTISSRNKEKALIESRNRIQSLPKASSNVTVLLARKRRI